jgi:hypothetical protein
MQTISKVYDSYGQAQAAVRDLESTGVPASEISLVASNTAGDISYGDGDSQSATATGAEVGAAVGGGVGLLTGLGLLAIPGLGPVVAVGWLASTAVGAVAGSATGGIVGALVDAGTPETEAHVYSEAIRRGGTLVTVQTSRTTDEIRPILDRHGPIDTATRRAEYMQAGWNGFDPKAPAFMPDTSRTEPERRSAQ